MGSVTKKQLLGTLVGRALAMPYAKKTPFRRSEVETAQCEAARMLTEVLTDPGWERPWSRASILLDVAGPFFDKARLDFAGLRTDVDRAWVLERLVPTAEVASELFVEWVSELDEKVLEIWGEVFVSPGERADLILRAADTIFVIEIKTTSGEATTSGGAAARAQAERYALLFPVGWWPKIAYYRSTSLLIEVSTKVEGVRVTHHAAKRSIRPTPNEQLKISREVRRRQ